jgi:hypothetical protein
MSLKTPQIVRGSGLFLRIVVLNPRAADVDKFKFRITRKSGQWNGTSSKSLKDMQREGESVHQGFILNKLRMREVYEG